MEPSSQRVLPRYTLRQMGKNSYWLLAAGCWLLAEAKPTAKPESYLTADPRQAGTGCRDCFEWVLPRYTLRQMSKKQLLASSETKPTAKAKAYLTADLR